MSRKKVPILDIFLLLFLSIYCWGFVLNMKLVGDYKDYNWIELFEEFRLMILLPLLFGYGIYLYNKDYFKNLIEKYFYSKPKN